MICAHSYRDTASDRESISPEAVYGRVVGRRAVPHMARAARCTCLMRTLISCGIAIVGGQIPLATGVAFRFQVQKDDSGDASFLRRSCGKPERS